MPTKVEIKNLNRLLTKLEAMKNRSQRDNNASVIVGYTASYAIYVHENLEVKHSGEPRKSGLGAYWGPSFFGPKFLERPARALAGEMAGMIVQAISKGRTAGQALMATGLRLQRASQELVSVEYGILRASAFTRLEQGYRMI